MGIQISEDKLSPRAKAALKNAKSKSQFLRDAIEYYVSRDTGNVTQFTHDDIPDIKSDIKEIKEILRNLSNAGIDDYAAREAAATTMDEKPVKAKGTVIDLPVESKIKAADASTGKKDKLDKTSGPIDDNEAKRREAERLLDDSIDMLG